jgi:Ca2+-binding RTX toxin-like protein
MTPTSPPSFAETPAAPAAAPAVTAHEHGSEGAPRRGGRAEEAAPIVVMAAAQLNLTQALSSLAADQHIQIRLTLSQAEALRLASSEASGVRLSGAPELGQLTLSGSVAALRQMMATLSLESTQDSPPPALPAPDTPSPESPPHAAAASDHLSPSPHTDASDIPAQTSGIAFYARSELSPFIAQPAPLHSSGLGQGNAPQTAPSEAASSADANASSALLLPPAPRAAEAPAAPLQSAPGSSAPMALAPNWPVMQSFVPAPVTPAPILPANLAPLLSIALADQAATQDSAFSFTLPAGSFTDPDPDDTLTYSATLTSGGALPAWLSFNAATRSFSGTPLNAHVGILSLRVTASDGKGGTASDDFLLTVANVNDAPTGLTLSATSIAENSATGTVIGTLSGIDPDIGDTLSYSIAPGGDPSGLFAVVGAQLRVNGALDFETTASYGVTLRVTDAAGSVFDQAFTLSVTNVNEAPATLIDANASANTLAENAANGTLAGITALATDPDAGDSITYSLSDNAGGRFAIHATTGVVTVANGSLLNFEAATSHSITVRATDSGGLTRDQTFTIAVTNVNEAPKDILISSGTINENSAIGTLIGTLSAVDDDVGNTHSYTLLSDPDSKFSLSGNQLLVNGPLNFEQKASHNVQIRVTDNTGLSFTKTLTITVADVNDAPATYNQTFNLAENSAVGALVVRANGLTPLNRVAASDEDAGATLTYAILGGNTGGTFAIHAGTGQISVANASLLDYEVPANRVFTLTVRVSDGTLSTDAIVTINITDVNEPLSAPTLSASTINENSPNGTIIGTLAAIDPEGQPITYTLTDTAGGRFSIVGNQLRVADGSLLDFETNTSHSITVQASDGVHTQTQSFTITVNDVNEGSLNVLPASFSGAEDTTFTLSGISFTDPTPGTTNHVTFSVASGTLTLATAVGGGITAGMVTGNGTGSVTVTGATQAQINATLADVNGLRFTPAADFNGSVLLTMSADDGSGNTDIDSAGITINAVNDAPTLSGLLTSVTYLENTINAAPQLIDADVTLSDVDTPASFNGGHVRIAYVSGAAATDTLSVRHQGNAAGQIGVSGTTVSFGGVAIGTIGTGSNGGLSGNALQITLNSNATLAAVEALIENLTYQSSSNIPAASRTLRLTINDGAGGTSPNYDITVNITPENDAPVLAAPLSAQGTDIATAYAYTIPGGTFVDPDGDTMTYSMEFSSNNGVSWNAGTPTGLSFNPATRALAAAAGAVAQGSYILRLTASDGTLATDHSFAFNVTSTAAFVYTGTANQSMGGSAASGSDIIMGGDGADLIYAGAGNDTVYGRGGNDTLYLDHSASSSPSHTGRDLAFGGDGNDLIYGDVRGDSSRTTTGDTIYGENGNDTLYGRSGDDWLDGGAGNDILHGEAHDDTLYGGTGNDSLLGGTGDDFLSGDEGNDTLIGGVGNDTISGGEGADTIIGSAGGDLLSGGAGADRFEYVAFSESRAGIGLFDTITDFDAAEDVIRVPFFTGIIEGFGNATGTLLEWYQTGSGGSAKTIIRANPAEYDFYIELTGHVNLTLANFSFYGTAGTTGNDTLTGTAGTDAIQGGAGDDIIYGLAGNDLLLGGEGNDTIYGGAGVDEIDGEAGDDWLEGGGAGGIANTVRGGSGNDTITMGNASEGISSIFGDDGNDMFRFNSLLGSDQVDYVIIEDFEKGVDRIWLDNMPFRDVYIGGINSARHNDLRISYNDALDLTFVQSNYNVSTRIFTFALRGDFVTNADASLNLDASDFIFTNFSDNDAGDADPAAGVIREADFTNSSGIIGTSGNDTIYAGYEASGFFNGFDNINAGDGDDVIVYKYISANTSGTMSDYGHTMINPSFGQDYVFITGARGTSFGSSNFNIFISNNFDSNGDTVISGQNHRLIMRQGTGADMGISSSQNDDLRMGGGNDTVFGQRGVDLINGESGNDVIYAGEGADTRVAGNSGNDWIHGGYGGDALWGGNENSTGSGADTFVYYDPLESRNATANRDRILDFGADDTIILHGFTGIGTGATEVQISNYNATQFGYVNENWTDIFASDAGIDFRLTVRGTFTFTSGNGTLILNPGSFGTSGADNLSGTASADFIFGLEGNDTINAGDGNDSLWGGDGNDSLLGQAGDDSISGGFGNDTLIGGLGADTLEGGSGVDRFVFNLGDSDTLTGMDVIWDFREGNDADLIDLSDTALDAIAPGGSLDWSDLVFDTPDQIGGYMTRVTISGTSFGFFLVGYWEKDYNIIAADFVF